MPSSTDKLLIVLCHLSPLVGLGILFPLVVYLVKKDGSPSVEDNAREALNFHISLYLYAFVCGLLIFLLIGFPLLFLLGIWAFVLAIIAAARGSRGEAYRYPLCLRLIR